MDSGSKKWLVLSLASAAAIGFGVYYYFNRKPSKGQKNQKNQEPEATDERKSFSQERVKIKLNKSEKMSNSQEFRSLLKAKFNFELEEEDGNYTKEAILTVLSTFYELKFPDFVILFNKYRKVRRDYLDDMDKYVDCGFEYLKSLPTLFMDDFAKLYEYKVIDPQKWALSQSAHSIDDADVNDLMFAAIDDWEKRLPSSKLIKKSEFFRIMEKEKEFLKKELKDLENQKKYIKMTGNVFEYLVLVNAKCSDHIHRLFNVENEDVLRFAVQNEDDPEIKQLENDIEELTGQMAMKIDALLS